jgi:hypothetical protein
LGESRRKSQVTVSLDRRGDLFPFFLPIVLFLAVTAISGQFVVGLVVLSLAFCVGREPLALLGQRLNLLAAAVVAYAGVCLCSGLWSHFGGYARQESIKTLVALTVFVLILSRIRTTGVRNLLWTLNGVLAAVGLLCVDGSSWRVLSRGFSWLMERFASLYPLESMGYEAGVRITGIFANANVSAGILAFGLILSLYLFQTEREEKGRAIAGLTLGVQAFAFFLSFSMGAMGAFAVTCLVYLACAGKAQRLRLFLLMVESVLVTVLCAFVAYPLLGTETIIPVLLALVCGGLIWALDRFVGRPVATALENHGKAVGISIAALAILLVGYGVLAMNITGSINLDAGTPLSRAVALSAGEYHVAQVSSTTQVQVEIYSQDDQQLMMHTRTSLYQGELSQASFAVPDGARVVWFVMQGEGGLEEVLLSNGTKVPLGYPLLPGFAANRLQALWANQNFIQRLVFFRDGIQLWTQSPFVGWGAGGVEGQLTAVQSFYYESKYIHNHFIQILDEAGMVGLAAFLFLLGSALWTLVRRWKTKQEPNALLPMLAACLTMMVSHSLTEVVWSTQMYQVVVFVLFAAFIVDGADPDAAGKRGQARWGAVVAWGFVTVFALFQAGSLAAAWRFSALSSGGVTPEQFVDQMGQVDFLEVYDDTTYKVNRMANALQIGQTEVAAKCARDLMALEEFDAAYYAAAYYYLPLGQLEEYFQATQVGLAQEASNPDAWNSIFDLYRQALDQLDAEDMEVYVMGVCQTGAWLEEFNQGRMQEIVLSQSNQAFLNSAWQLGQTGVFGQTAYEVLRLSAEETAD